MPLMVKEQPTKQLLGHFNYSLKIGCDSACVHRGSRSMHCVVLHGQMLQALDTCSQMYRYGRQLQETGGLLCDASNAFNNKHLMTNLKPQVADALSYAIRGLLVELE